jgi:hypothetical protein
VMACASSRSDRHLGDWLGSIDSQVGVVSVQQGARVTEPSEKKKLQPHIQHISPSTTQLGRAAGWAWVA